MNEEYVHWTEQENFYPAIGERERVRNVSRYFQNQIIIM